jgi:hypothetical protein
VFYYADEFNVSWLPTLRALWSPRGQQIVIPTHWELFPSLAALLQAAHAFFDSYNWSTERVLSIIGAHAA